MGLYVHNVQGYTEEHEFDWLKRLESNNTEPIEAALGDIIKKHEK